MNRRAETSERVVETFTETAGAEGGVCVRVHELGVCAHRQPFGDFRADVCREVVALVVDVGIAENAILAVIAERHIVLRAFAAAARAYVVVLLECPVFVVEVEIIGIAHT